MVVLTDVMGGLTLEQFVNLYAKQQGLCAYPGFPMSLDVKQIGGEATDWALSPERLNDDGGYTIDNLVLVVKGQFCRARSARRQTSQVVQEEGR